MQEDAICGEHRLFFMIFEWCQTEPLYLEFSTFCCSLIPNGDRSVTCFEFPLELRPFDLQGIFEARDFVPATLQGYPNG